MWGREYRDMRFDRWMKRIRLGKCEKLLLKSKVWELMQTTSLWLLCFSKYASIISCSTATVRYFIKDQFRFSFTLVDLWCHYHFSSKNSRQWRSRTGREFGISIPKVGMISLDQFIGFPRSKRCGGLSWLVIRLLPNLPCLVASLMRVHRTQIRSSKRRRDTAHGPEKISIFLLSLSFLWRKWIPNQNGLLQVDPRRRLSECRS